MQLMVIKYVNLWQLKSSQISIFFYDNPPLEEDGFYCPAVDVSMSSPQSVQAHKTFIK